MPFVNAWFPLERRGVALGVFGAGMGGTAISAFTTVQLVKAFGPGFPFDLVAAALVVYAVLAAVLLREPRRSADRVRQLCRAARGTSARAPARWFSTWSTR